MERILTTEQMRNADNYTIEKLGVSQEILVERAGSAVAEEIIKRFPGGRVLVCIGVGNNGADGKVVAAILAKKHGFSVNTINVSNGIFKLFDKKYDIIVDCIFGTGLNRPVEGKFKKAIDLINKSGAYVVSCDIPSGLNGDSGLVMGVAVKANLTVAIQEYKLGHFLNDGVDYCGDVVAKDIGISIWGEDFIKRLNSSSLSKYFLPRKRNSHKGDYGKCAIIGGSVDYTGSVILTANALSAFKMGSGYVNLVVPKSLFNAYVGKIPECLLTGILDYDGKIQLDEKVLDKLLGYDSIAIGMGMGTDKGTYDVVTYLLSNYKGELIIDADAINSLSIYGVDVLKNAKCKVVLTPHVGEFSRLSGLSKDKILSEPIRHAQCFAKEYNLTILLKNAVSVITDGIETYLNTTGCSGMAKAGSGDVLSGVLAGILCNNPEETVVENVAVACYLFGKAGEFAEGEQNEYSMTASDIIRNLYKAINYLR